MKNNSVKTLWRRNVLTASLMIGMTAGAHAQKVDFNNNTENEVARTATGYTAWVVSDITSTGTQSMTFDNGVTMTISLGEGSMANRITRSWNKNLVSAGDELRLIQDGIIGKKGGDQLTSGMAAIKVTLSGLSAGQHSVTAYHNFVDRGITNCPPISVKLGSTVVQSGIAQTYCETSLTKAATAKTSVEFTTSDNEQVEITYYTVPADGVTYDCTSFCINGIEIGEVSGDKRATTPSPENGDYHAVFSNGSVTLSWEAASGATTHTVYVAESAAALSTATGTSTTATTLTKSGLSPLKRYYWRVDETIDGETYPGEVWEFQPRRDAFPGAEGYGRYAIGGRGAGDGIVYHVTSLDDNVSNPAEGTFRYGITQLSGPRTIVFDVAGVITLQGRLTCSDKYVTIAGQTAPGRGIMFKAAPFGMASDGITRFVRARLGHLGVSSESTGLDGLGMAGNDHSIMDHCSISWTIDEGFSSRNAKNITLQRTLISEALNVAGHPNYSAGTGHGYAATIGGGEMGGKGSSFHHNLLAHNEGRNWSMSGGLDGAGYYDGHHDMFNNVCYNWGSRATDGGTHEGQFVNNYYKMGQATTQKILLKADLEGTGMGSQAYYVSGNIRENKDGSITNDAENETYKYTLSGGQTLDWTVFQSQPFFESMATIETAQSAFRNVLSDVGCNQPELDNHDIRMVDETLNRTYTTTGSYDNVSDGLIDSEEDSGCEGFSGLNIITESRAADWDTDQDGIPDWFETAKGWSTTTANNNACDDEVGYYTNLEEYLNWMAEPHFYNLTTGTPETINLSDYFAGYTSATYTISANGLNTSLSGTQLTFIPTKGGLTSFSVTASQGGISLTRTFNVHAEGEDTEEEVYEELTTTEGWTAGSNATITNSTYKSTTGTTDDKNCVWNFSNGFKVGRTTGDGGYQSATNNGDRDFIKYSANYEYTITIPEGVRVTGIDFFGYSNNDSEGAYIATVNGTDYESTEYTLPSRTISYSEFPTYHFDFSTPVEGTLTFTAKGKQVCLQITLYTEEVNTVDCLVLKESATVYATSTGPIEARTYGKVRLERTLSNSYYSTLCVPFALSAEEISKTFGNGEVLALKSVHGTVMKFDAVESMEAGVPYIVKPETTVENPEFENMAIADVAAGTSEIDGYAYTGHYERYRMPHQSNELFLGTDGKLKWPKAYPANYTYGLRATFTVPDGAASNVQVLLEGATNGMLTVEAGQWKKAEGIYNLNGQAINAGRQLPKGIYIVNGKKMVIR